MNIKQGLTDITNNMEVDIGKYNERFQKIKADYGFFAPLDLWTSYVREIRTVVNLMSDTLKPLTQNKTSQEELKKVEMLEQVLSGGSMVFLVGGSSDGDMIQLDPKMPINAKTLITNQVYILKEDGKLHFSEEETEKLKGTK